MSHFPVYKSKGEKKMDSSSLLRLHKYSQKEDNILKF